MAASSTTQQDRFSLLFEEWMQQQKQDLQELLLGLTQEPKNESRLRELISKALDHFKTYTNTRCIYAKENAFAFFSPKWCTSFEASYLWISGCRPTMAIRLVYALVGSELESQLEEFLRGVRRGNIAELSAAQLVAVNSLHGRTVMEEDKLSRKMTSLQEDMADNPKKEGGGGGSGGGEREDMVGKKVESLAGLLEAADKLRVGTMRELVEEILTPLQAVELLVATKQIHLRMHEWGRNWDLSQGSSTG
ncbi:hypothetical protein QJS10_CPB12g00715 [Acorus calamus]|uniref:DOG1 domain-containing protein n=1 Tax=Acorus calamus TaxID=4465 RepID=A0AAV9DNX4_ACOCL|nr:hypothetical protein QJS10_CPB12g00715 [Acorus calamus]